ncbi:MAG: hypothetical protein PHC68_16865 [Syntrophorhabdaceae bacterium]|nr:hypothetical protein [Syntrophorhabdaceae bacterium]
MISLDTIVEREFLKIREELQIFDVHLENNNLPGIFSWDYAITKGDVGVPVKFTKCAAVVAMAQYHFAGRDPLEVLVRYRLLWAISEFVPEEIKRGKFSDLLQTSSLHMSLSFPSK